MSKKREVILGNMLEVLDTIEENSIDAIVCDPPYEINFMGRGWDNSGIAFQKETWEKCLRVLKPGGYLVAFGACRTSHRITCAIEDAGFEIRDTLQWVFGCLTEDAEVLTEHGWKKGIQIQEGDKIAQWCPHTNVIDLAPVQKTYRAPWDGPLRKIQHSDTDQLLTPNHRVYVQTYDRVQKDKVRGGSWCDWKAVEAKDLPYRFRIPVSGVSNGIGIGGEDYAALLGWVWTEGGFDDNGSGVRIYQSSVNQEKCDEIETLLNKLDTRHKKYQRERVYTRRNGESHTYIEYTWFFSGELAKKIRKDLPGKHPTYELLWKMTSHEINALIRAAMLGDGSGWGSKSQQFYQKNMFDLEWFQTALHLSNRSGKTSMRYNRQNGSVYLRNRHISEIQPRHLKNSWQDYKGDVWCVQVPTGAFVARRNGHVFITGNSGFPKSLDVGKAIDKEAGAVREVVGDGPNATRRPRPGDGATIRMPSGDPITAPATDLARTWHGYGTALKPAHEPITLARKPLAGTVARNVAEWGTGGIDVDGCRVGESKNVPASRPTPSAGHGIYGAKNSGADNGHDPNVGRWPPNIILGDGAGEVIDGMAPKWPSRAAKPLNRGGGGGNIYGSGLGAMVASLPTMSGNASEFFPTFCYVPKASRKEREAGLEEAGIEPLESGIRNNHPTVKPVAIMQWLVKLVCPPRDLDPVVLDPFCGSGTTGIACVHENVRFIGIEMEERHAAIARARIAHAEGEISLDDLNELFG